MKLSRTTRSAVPVFATLLAALLAGPWLAAQAPDSSEMNSLLQEARTQSHRLAMEADQMTSYTRSATAWESHAQQINIIKQHINDLGKTLQKMQDIHAQASPWQQQAVERVVPLGQELAHNVEVTIAHINQNKAHIDTPQYRRYLAANSEMATDIADLIRDYTQYSRHKAAYEHLSQELETPQG